MGPYSAASQQIVFIRAHLLYPYHNVWAAIYTYSLDTIRVTGPVFCALALVAVRTLVSRHWLKPETIAISVFFVPFAFYVTSLYSGQAALFMPDLGSNHILFNVRYGPQMVAPIAMFIAILAASLKFRQYPGWSRL